MHHAVVVHVRATGLCYYKFPKLPQRICAMVKLLKEALNRHECDVSAFNGFSCLWCYPKIEFFLFVAETNRLHLHSALNLKLIFASCTLPNCVGQASHCSSCPLFHDDLISKNNCNQLIYKNYRLC